MELSWTTELPTQCGYYWYKDSCGAEILRLYYYSSASEEGVLCTQYGDFLSELKPGEWAGPLEPPR